MTNTHAAVQLIDSYTFTFPIVIATIITIRAAHNPSTRIAKTARAA